MSTSTDTTLEGRTAVITGASSGLGEATAELLAVRGASVALLARRADRLEALAARITERGGRALALPVDVTDAAAVEAAAGRVADEFGGADLLFNNAGVMLPAPITERRADQWRHMLDLNLTGLMHAIGAFIPQLVAAAAERGVADLVNTSSIGAQSLVRSFAVYCGTKAYTTHLSKNLRLELGELGVRVCALEPGITRTELERHVTDPGAREWVDLVKDSPQMLDARDVAEAVAFVAAQPPRVNFQQLTIMPTVQAM